LWNSKTQKVAFNHKSSQLESLHFHSRIGSQMQAGFRLIRRLRLDTEF